MRIILLLLSLIVLHYSYGQATLKKIINPKKSEDNHLILSGGINLNRNLFGEIGVMYGNTFTRDNNCCECLPGVLGAKISTEFGTINNVRILAPKLSLEFAFIFIGARISVIDYTDYQYHDFKLTPELGVTIGGYLDLFYGYNIPISNVHIKEIGLHKISIIINYDKFFFKIFRKDERPTSTQ